MMDFDLKNFDEDVIAGSASVPVVVDFWAPWCGPCQAIGPVLEKLANEADGTWRLVKVNTDQHGDIGQQYGVRGIPAVKMFVDGKVVDEFTGALPEYAVKQWLEKAIPTEAKQHIATAERRLDEGAWDEAETLLEQALKDEPNHAKARAMLASLIVLRDPHRAVDLASAAGSVEPTYLFQAEAVKTIAMRLTTPADWDESLPGAALYQEAIDALHEADVPAALEKLMTLIQVDRFIDNDGGRRLGIALFTLFADRMEAVRGMRRLFDMYLS
jgi:putative thioredoxin